MTSFHTPRLLFLLLLFWPLLLLAAGNHVQQVQQLIDAGDAPEGVVFEIVQADKRFLDWALPEADRLSRKLRHRFPELDIVIVSHGSEQFALTRQQLDRNTALKQQLQSLVAADVEVHVCGTLAENRNVAAEEFSELVDVAAEGPAQINDYIKLGYVRIRISK